jgi:PTS system cellobiose-specific IIB component
MKNIVLICAAGMSTSLLVSKMQKCANDVNYDCHIQAYALSEAKEVIPAADIVLLGPQVRYNLKSIKEQYPAKKIELIDMAHYGAMNGEAVLSFARKCID